MRNTGWWYWLLTVWLMIPALAGYETALVLVTVVTGAQLLHAALASGSASSPAVQARLGFLVLLLLGESLPLFHWLAFAEAWLVVLLDRSALRRLVAAMPWNQAEYRARSWAAVTASSWRRPSVG